MIGGTFAAERHDVLAEMSEIAATVGRAALSVGILAVVLAALAPSSPARADTAEQIADRAAMLRTIERHAQSATDALGRDHIDPAVLRVMGQLPRHAFVPGTCRTRPMTTGRCRSATARPSRSRSSSR